MKGSIPDCMVTDEMIITAACKRATESGADIAGFLPAYMLTDCPSALADGERGFSSKKGSFIVLGLFHDPDKPEMDFWEEGRSTPGDRCLESICREICAWLENEYGRVAEVIPYQISDGGIYLKDAAVLAGLGIIGKSNLVLVPGFGPQIRFRALWADPEPGVPERCQIPLPCSRCEGFCMKNCPVGAFPDGSYSRILCLNRMNADKTKAKVQSESESQVIPARHCRVCELSCPAVNLMR